jgi:hypothetical protein
MAASLSLMSIVAEREVFAHERLTFLKIIPYVTAKLAVLGIVCTLQTLFFVALLVCIRKGERQPDAMLYGLGWSAATLILASWTALALGLLISAASGHKRHVASFILPLVMMAQIVFSAHVAGEGEGSVHEAYRALDLDRRLASGCSRLTISRWADVALRSFAYQRTDYAVFRGTEEDRLGLRTGNSAQRYLAWWRLIEMFALFALLSMAVLWLQEKRSDRQHHQN